VGYILDADIRSFFDEVSQEWRKRGKTVGAAVDQAGRNRALT
jgi:hypothetical protein